MAVEKEWEQRWRREQRERHHFRYIRAGFVDSASEKNKAREVAEIYLIP